ncbi:hypothetical protein BZL29_6574 [Mycobacterium kansasii]|uniref:Uncharacterized protein n=1 Tax=Mycobacterium kansasii TaxID=1768 RepID=A0A1V3WPY9_MYCKA|nr:hypothetical protein BZL29_6574 [Mycobacterium kansasii]
MRRLLVEAAWHHRSAYRPAVALRRPGSGPAAAAPGPMPTTSGCMPAGST